FPVDIALHPEGRFAAVIHCGQGTHEVVVVELKSRAMVTRVTIPEGFYGLCFSKSGEQLFASGGEYNVIHRWKFGKDGLISDHAAIRIAPAKESFVVRSEEHTSELQ